MQRLSLPCKLSLHQLSVNTWEVGSGRVFRGQPMQSLNPPPPAGMAGLPNPKVCMGESGCVCVGGGNPNSQCGLSDELVLWQPLCQLGTERTLTGTALNEARGKDHRGVPPTPSAE